MRVLLLCLLMGGYSSLLLAQKLSDREKAFLLEQLEMPAIAYGFGLSFTEEAMHLNKAYDPEAYSEATLADKLKQLEAVPADYEMTKAIARTYLQMGEENKSEPYYARAYGLASGRYEEDPNNAEKMETLLDLLIELNSLEAAQGLLNDYVKTHPKLPASLQRDRAYLALYTSQPTDVVARYLQEAYKADPTSLEIYSHLLSRNLLQLMQDLSDDEPRASSNGLVAMPLLDKAVEEGKTPFASMTKDLTVLLCIYTRALFENQEQYHALGKSGFTFDLPTGQKDLLASIEKRSEAALEKGYENLYTFYKMLVVINILQNDPTTALRYLKAGPILLKEDPELLALLALGYGMKKNNKKGIDYLYQAIKKNSREEAQLFLVRWLILDNRADEAMAYLEGVEESTRLAYAKAYLAFQKNDWDKACRYLEELDKPESANKMTTYQYYYQAVRFCHEGNRNRAKAIFGALSALEGLPYAAAAEATLKELYEEE